MTQSSFNPNLRVVLFRGDDETLQLNALRSYINSLSVGLDLSLALDDFSSDDYEVAALVDACQTPPMFTPRRIVVGRSMGRFSTSELEPLLAYLTGINDTSTLLLTTGGGQLAKKLLDAVKKVGDVIDTGAPSGKARSGWVSDLVDKSGLKLEQRAQLFLADHVGDDVSRLPGILAVLSASFGPTSRISVADLEPYLGDQGGTTPWALTDCIDSGDTPGALGALSRMKDRHALVIMSSLQTHFLRILALDGANCRDEVSAAKVLGMSGSTFPAKKALGQYKRLGSSNAKKAIELLGQADLDLRGMRDIGEGCTMEVLVARLSKLASKPSSRR